VRQKRGADKPFKASTTGCNQLSTGYGRIYRYVHSFAQSCSGKRESQNADDASGARGGRETGFGRAPFRQRFDTVGGSDPGGWNARAHRENNDDDNI